MTLKFHLLNLGTLIRSGVIRQLLFEEPFGYLIWEEHFANSGSKFNIHFLRLWIDHLDAVDITKEISFDFTIVFI